MTSSISWVKTSGQKCTYIWIKTSYISALGCICLPPSSPAETVRHFSQAQLLQPKITHSRFDTKADESTFEHSKESIPKINFISRVHAYLIERAPISQGNANPTNLQSTEIERERERARDGAWSLSWVIFLCGAGRLWRKNRVCMVGVKQHTAPLTTPFGLLRPLHTCREAHTRGGNTHTHNAVTVIDKPCGHDPQRASWLQSNKQSTSSPGTYRYTHRHTVCYTCSLIEHIHMHTYTHFVPYTIQ